MRLDARLRPLTSAPQEGADGELAAILEQHVRPVIRRVLKGRLRISLSATDGAARNQDGLELESELLGRMTRELERLRSQAVDSIGDLDAFTGTVTARACADYVRTKYPSRTRLHHRLLYAIRQSPRWHERLLGDGRLRLGASERPIDRDIVFQRVRRAFQHDSLHSRNGIVALLDASLDTLDGTVTLSTLLDACSHELQEVRHIDAEHLDTLAATEPSATEAMEWRACAADVWDEIAELPHAQRTALLLNLRDAQGDNALLWLVRSATASLDRIARALDWSVEQLIEAWPDLPYSDDRIGASLGCTRQQVINLRKAARARLSRRLKKWQMPWT